MLPYIIACDLLSNTLSFHFQLLRPYQYTSSTVDGLLFPTNIRELFDNVFLVNKDQRLWILYDKDSFVAACFAANSIVFDLNTWMGIGRILPSEVIHHVMVGDLGVLVQDLGTFETFQVAAETNVIEIQSNRYTQMWLKLHAISLIDRDADLEEFAETVAAQLGSSDLFELDAVSSEGFRFKFKITE